MGHRHLRGFAELERIGRNNFELVAVCDEVADNAGFMAEEASRLLGRRPNIALDLDELEKMGVKALDVTTTPRSHHEIVSEAVERNWHIMVEKPMGLTVRACNVIRECVDRSELVVSVAENFRRDPISRLARALLEAQAIGSPRLMIQQSVSGSDLMTISKWRHQKDQSGVLLDVDVHTMDMAEYLLGEIEEIYSRVKLHERVRRNPAAYGQEGGSNPAGVYGRWQAEMPAEFEATAEDAAYSTLGFKSGAVGQFITDHAGHGEVVWRRQIFGAGGSMLLPKDRSGGCIILNRDGEPVLDDQRILDLVPDFHLDEITSALFASQRPWRYEFDFSSTDRKLIAVEYADFARAIEHGSPPEVDVEQGMRSVAAAYAVLESGTLGLPVRLRDMISGKIDAYQRDIDCTLFPDV
jgi:predicted dehydrogenase